MTITIESNDGQSRNVIDVDAYGPVGTSLFSLRTVLELVTRGIMDANRFEEKQAASDAALREEAMQNAAVRA